MKTPWLALLLAALASPGCRSAAPSTRASDSAAVHAIRATLAELYDAFCFDAGAEPDWDALRQIFADGAAFVPSIRADRRPVANDAERFVADFRAFVSSEPYRSTGFHERIVGVQIDAFGGIAHAFVAFEGFVPADGATVTRGLDSLQLVHDGTAWRLVSFTTQYEDDALRLPRRFVDPGAGSGRE